MMNAFQSSLRLQKPLDLPGNSTLIASSKSALLMRCYRQLARQDSGLHCPGPQPPLTVVTEPAAAVGSPTEAPQATVTSKMYVNGICCASEIPLIRNLLMPLPGVQKVPIPYCNIA